MFSAEYPAALSALLVIFLVGLHFGWPSHAVPKLQSPESPVLFSKSDGSWLISASLFSGIFAFPAAAYLFNKIGRKKTILLIAIPYTIGWTILAFFNHTIYLIFIGQACLGFGDSIGLTTIPFYLSEISRTNVRGGVSSLFSVMYNLGTLVSVCTGPYLPFHVFPFIPLGSILVFVLTFYGMPETPHFFVLKDNYTGALDALRKLRGDDGNIEEELSSVKAAVHQDCVNVSLLDIITDRVNRKSFFIVAMLVTFEQFSGITTILFYAQRVFGDSTDVFSPEFSAIIFNITFLLGSMLSSMFVDKLGRRPLALISCIGCAVFLLLQGTFFYLKAHNLITNLDQLSWLGLVLLIPYVIFASSGLVNIPMVMMGELFHTRFKGVGSVAFGMYISVVIIAATKFFQFTSDEIAIYFPFFCYTGCCLVGVFFVYNFMPETKNKSLAQIQIELQVLKPAKVDKNLVA